MGILFVGVMAIGAVLCWYAISLLRVNGEKALLQWVCGWSFTLAAMCLVLILGGIFTFLIMKFTGPTIITLLTVTIFLACREDIIRRKYESQKEG